MERLNDLLTGWWRITSFHIEFADAGDRLNLYGVDPLGYIVFMSGRTMSILTSRERAGRDAVALFESMMAYTGSYRVEGDGKVIIEVDAAWQPAWVGTRQVRFLAVEGDALSIATAWQSHPLFPERTARGFSRAQRL